VEKVSLAGTWYKIVDGKSEGTYEVRRYQGMGNTTREAKFDAATNAILKMGEAVPGVYIFTCWILSYHILIRFNMI